MKVQMYIFLDYSMIIHCTVQPDHHYCVFILIEKNTGSVQSIASFGPHIDSLKKI